METKKYIKLYDLEVYKLARELSKLGWEIYNGLDWQTKKTMGDQLITSTDSVGANIAEGYGRYHYLDKVKFFYNARGSLMESLEHWLELLHERGKVQDAIYQDFKNTANKASLKLQNMISTTYKVRKK
jgi:four helix bundle protein